jgi:HEAT repeat protein
LKSQSGIFTTDSHLVVRRWDAWLEKVTARPAAEVCGQPLTQLFPEIERRGLLAAFQRVLEQGAVELLSPALHGYLIECSPPAGASDTRTMLQRAVIAPLREGAAITGLIVTIEDVTVRGETDSESIEALGADDWRTRRQAVERILAEPRENLVAELVNRLRGEHRDPSLLNSILPLLSSGVWENLDPLIQLTRDEEAEVRMYVAQALGNLKDRRAIPALLALLADADVNVRYHSIEALAKLRASEAAEALVGIAESGEFFLAFAALDALRDIGDPNVAARLVPLLDNETVGTAAIGALAQVGDHNVVAPLVPMLDRPRLVPAVAEALTTIHQRYERQLGEGDYVTDLVSSNITETGAKNLLAALNTTTGERLRIVVRVLGWVGGETVIAELTRLLGSPALRSEVIETFVRHGARVSALLAQQLEAEDLETRRAATAALGRIGDPQSVPALIRALPDPELTVDVAGALARIGDSRAYGPLLKLLGHDRAAVRRAAIGALNSLGHPRMPQDVRQLLTNSDPRLRESAVRIAGYFGYTECAPLLLKAIHDGDENVRRAAVENLPNLDESRVLSVLLTAIRDESPKIRGAAAQSLGHLESVASVPALTLAMRDSDEWVRYYAVRALGQIRSPESIDALASALREDQAVQVRIAAADALGAIGGRRIVSVLAPFVNSEDSNLSRAALLALGVVGHPDALHPILSALRSDDPLRRLNAVRAIAARRDHEAAEALQWTAGADNDEAVAAGAIEELSKMATSESIAALLRLASDRRLREKAIVQISRLGLSHLESIKAGLSSPQLETRRAVVEALGRMKTPEASVALSIALDDDRPEVRLAALLALRRLGSHVSERRLWSMAQNDPDSGVREAARQGLQGGV